MVADTLRLDWGSYLCPHVKLWHTIVSVLPQHVHLLLWAAWMQLQDGCRGISQRLNTEDGTNHLTECALNCCERGTTLAGGRGTYALIPLCRGTNSFYIKGAQLQVLILGMFQLGKQQNVIPFDGNGLPLSLSLSHIYLLSL